MLKLSNDYELLRTVEDLRLCFLHSPWLICYIGKLATKNTELKHIRLNLSRESDVVFEDYRQYYRLLAGSYNYVYVACLS